jgi:hypothetical protein
VMGRKNNARLRPNPSNNMTVKSCNGKWRRYEEYVAFPKKLNRRMTEPVVVSSGSEKNATAETAKTSTA